MSIHQSIKAISNTNCLGPRISERGVSISKLYRVHVCVFSSLVDVKCLPTAALFAHFHAPCEQLAREEIEEWRKGREEGADGQGRGARPRGRPTDC